MNSLNGVQGYLTHKEHPPPSGGELRTPSFFYKPGSQPEGMAAVQKTIKDAVRPPLPDYAHLTRCIN